jgi:hypothetical protein
MPLRPIDDPMSLRKEIFDILTSLPAVDGPNERMALIDTTGLSRLRIYLNFQGSNVEFAAGLLKEFGSGDKGMLASFLDELRRQPEIGLDRSGKLEKLRARVIALDDEGWRHEFGLGRTPEIEQYRRDFTEQLRSADILVGRADIFAALDRFESEHACGYFLLTADAGLGKTALAAAIARRRDAISFFASVSGGLTHGDQCLNHISAEINARFHLGYDGLPATAGEDATFLGKVLQQAVERAGRSVWLVIDGLDEAEVVPGRNPLSIPGRLPEGVYCFLTQRPGSPPLNINPGTPVVDYLLAWDAPMQRDDILVFLRREVARLEIANALHAAAPNRDPESFLSELAELSEGNFMYLSFVLPDIAAGHVTHTLPRGLHGFYAAMWSRMEALTREHGGDDWRTLYRPVIGLLAVAREPVTVAWLSDLSGCDREDVQNPVLYRWRRFLSCDGERWRILHRSFADFVGDQDGGAVDLKARHASVGRFYAESDSWAKHDSYASRQLAAHLRAAGDVAGLLRLVDDLAWYQNQVTEDPTGVRYESDLRVAWSLVGAADADAVAGGRAAPFLAHEVKIALIVATLVDHWVSIPSLVTLHEAGILSDVRTLGIVEKIAKKSSSSQYSQQASSTLIALAPTLSQTLLPHAVELARKLDPENRAEALLALAALVPGERRIALFDEALRSAQKMDDDEFSKPGLLCRASAELPAETRETCAHDARELCLREVVVVSGESAAPDNPVDRANRLAQLIGFVPDAADLVQDALRDANAKGFQLEDTAALVEMVQNVPESGRSSIAREAVKLAIVTSNPERRAYVLAALVRELPEAERSSVVTVALEAIRTIAESEVKLDRLFDLVASSSELDRSGLLDEAERLTLESEVKTQAAGLLRLAGAWGGARGRAFLDQALRLLQADVQSGDCVTLLTSSASHLEGTFKDEVLTTARALVPELPSRFARVRALIAIAQAWSGNQLRALAREATAEPAGIVAIGEIPDDTAYRAELLATLLRDLPVGDRSDALKEVRALLEEVEEGTWLRARVLAKILPVLDAEERTRTVQEIRAVVGSLEHADQRAELLIEILRFEPGDAPRDVGEALIQARSIGAVHVEGNFNSRTNLVNVSPWSDLNGNPARAILRLATIDRDAPSGALISESLDLTLDSESSLQDAMLQELAPYLAGAQIREVITRYHAMLIDPLRDELQRFLSERPADPVQHEDPSQTSTDDGISISVRPSQTSTDEGISISVRVNFGDAFRLLRDPTQVPIALMDNRGAPIKIGQENVQTCRSVARAFFAAFLEKIPKRDLDSVLEAGAKLRNGGWHWCMGILLRRLADTDSVEAAFETARGVWGDSLPPTVAALLLPAAPPHESRTLVHCALADAPGIKDPAERIVVMTLLLPYLDPPMSAKLLMDLQILLEEAKPLERSSPVSWWSWLFRRLDRDACPPSLLARLVQRRLREADSRQDALESLEEMLPAIRRIGGANAMRSIPLVVRDAVARVQ